MSLRQSGFWNHFRNVREAVLRVAQMNGNPEHMPTPTELEKASEGGLAAAIGKRHGGFPAVARRLGLQLSYTPKGYWMNLANVEYELSRYAAGQADEGAYANAHAIETCGAGTDHIRD